MIFGFSSCSNDDGNVNSIEGKWNYLSLKTRLYGQTISEVEYTHNEPLCGKDYIGFLADGTYFHGSFDIFEETCHEFTSNGSWEQDGVNLTVLINGETINYEVVSVSKNSLQLEWTYGSEGDDSPIMTLTFSKAVN